MRWSINELRTYRIPSRREYLRKLPAEDTTQIGDTFVIVDGCVLFITLPGRSPMKVEKIYYNKKAYSVYTSTDTCVVDCMVEMFELYGVIDPPK